MLAEPTSLPEFEAALLYVDLVIGLRLVVVAVLILWGVT